MNKWCVQIVLEVFYILKWTVKHASMARTRRSFTGFDIGMHCPTKNEPLWNPRNVFVK